MVGLRIGRVVVVDEGVSGCGAALTVPLTPFTPFTTAVALSGRANLPPSADSSEAVDAEGTGEAVACEVALEGWLADAGMLRGRSEGGGVREAECVLAVVTANAAVVVVAFSSGIFDECVLVFPLPPGEVSGGGGLCGKGV